MVAMLFAAGLGTRLKPFTDAHPKALFPIGGKTLLQWQIEMLRDVGIRDIIINVHHFAEQIIQYVEEHAQFGCNIRISDERAALLDTGGGLRKALALLPTFGKEASKEPLLLCNVDILSNIALPRFLQAASAETAAGALATLVVSERETQRYLLFDSQQQLKGWTNIATHALRPERLQQHPEEAAQYQRLAFSGMQVISPHIAPYLEEVAQEKGDVFSLIDLYLHICQHHPEVHIEAYVPTDYHMMDVGKTAQRHEAEQFAKDYLTAHA